MKIGARLRAARTAKGFSIYKLSKATYISQNHISAIENDKRQPTLETLERLIEPLGITLPELLNADNSATYLSDNERLLLENYRSMTNADAELIEKLASSLAMKKLL